MKFYLIIVCLYITASVHAGDVHIQVDGVNASGGVLRIGLYDSAANFRVKELPQSSKILIEKPGPVSTLIKDLKAGTYAVAVVWDKNSNGELDSTKGRFRIPIEPYGFSNNPKSRFGPPAFEKCTVKVAETGTTKLKITLR